DRLVESGVAFDVIGINNRDLRTFEVSLSTTERLIPAILSAFRDPIIVSESGIFTPVHVARVAAAGAHAVLVGESLMREEDPGAAAAHLMSAQSAKAPSP